MKIKKLIVELQKYNPEAVCIIALDQEEGEFVEFGYVSQINGEGWESSTMTIGALELTEELKELGADEDDLLENGEPCVIFYPEEIERCEDCGEILTPEDKENGGHDSDDEPEFKFGNN